MDIFQVSSHALVTSQSHSLIYKEKIWSLLNELQVGSRDHLHPSCALPIERNNGQNLYIDKLNN